MAEGLHEDLHLLTFCSNVGKTHILNAIGNDIDLGKVCFNMAKSLEKVAYHNTKVLKKVLYLTEL